MYDGIKIECAVTDPRKWDNSLRSIGKYDEATGEILPFASEANSCGLLFYKIPSPAGTKYTIQGSIHKFARSGGENNDDFNIAEVAATIQTLRDKFGIDPTRSRIMNLEFGVNIDLPEGITAGEFQKYLVSAYSKGFEKMNQRRAAVGYIAEFEEFSIKIYDKGYQSGSGETQQLRIEIKVLRTRWLEQFGIIQRGAQLYLSNLLDKNIIKAFGNILQNKISSLICTPRTLDIKKLTPKERLTYYECRDARSWEEWNSKTRERKQQQLQKIFLKCGQPDPVDVLARLVAEKWRELSRFTVPPAREPESTQKDTKSTVIVVGIRSIIAMIINGHIAIIRALLTKGEISCNSSCLIYAPRGKPLSKPPPERLNKGFSRWIDQRIRAPPKAVSVTPDCLIYKQNE